MKVLWLSRHPMTEGQMADLRATLRSMAHQPMDENLEVVTVNVTYPAHSADAVSMICGLIKEHDLPPVVAAVLPAHVAARLAKRQLPLPVSVLVPVAVPAPAVAGEVRGGGFVHSHWEVL